MGARSGTVTLALFVVGALVAGCQQYADPVGAPSTTAGPQRRVSDDPYRISPPAETGTTSGRGVVTGRVRTMTGAPVVNATVQVRSLDTPPVPVPELVVVTDDGGWFTWPLAPGRYEVTVRPPDDLPPVTAPVVDVRAGLERELDLTVG